MKPIICVFLIILMLIPIGVLAAHSPTVQKLIYNKSDIPIYMENDTRIFDKFDSIIGLHEKLVEVFGGEDYLVDDLFMIVLDTKQEQVKWHFTRAYDSNVQVEMVLFNDTHHYILNGTHFLKYVVFDFTDVVPSDAYYVVILSK